MTKQRILIVDDDRKISGLVRFFLDRRGGYEVREENHSHAALSAARSFQPDLVVLDVDMPGKDGGEVAAELRRDPQLREKPILFLSSLIGRGESRTSEGQCYLAKSAEPQELLDTVRRMLHAVADLPGPGACVPR